MVTIAQIVIIAFALFAWSRAVLRFRDRAISVRELVLWSVLWAAAIFVMLLPGTTDLVASLLGATRGADVVVYVSIALLFYLAFRLYVKLEQMEREITALVRELALSRRKR